MSAGHGVPTISNNAGYGVPTVIDNNYEVQPTYVDEVEVVSVGMPPQSIPTSRLLAMVRVISEQVVPTEVLLSEGRVTEGATVQGPMPTTERLGYGAVGV